MAVRSSAPFTKTIFFHARSISLCLDITLPCHMTVNNSSALLQVEPHKQNVHLSNCDCAHSKQCSLSPVGINVLKGSRHVKVSITG